MISIQTGDRPRKIEKKYSFRIPFLSDPGKKIPK